jgi:hypothetical protein
VQTRCLDTDGEPEDVCRYSVEAALTLLLEQLGVPAPSG